MKTYILYIGSNNETNELERGKAISILETHFDDFTVQYALRFWKGEEEDTIIVTIYDEARKVLACVDELKKELKQDAIGARIANHINFL